MGVAVKDDDRPGAGDHDKEYVPPTLNAKWHYPFTDWQYARLLLLRSKVRDDPYNGDTHVRENDA